MKNNNRRMETIFEANADYSSPINIYELAPRGCNIDIESDVWTAANIVIEVSRAKPGTVPPAYNSATWHPIKKSDGTKAVTTISGDGSYPAPPEAWQLGTYPWMRLRSVNTSNPDTPVNQAARRVVSVGLMY